MRTFQSDCMRYDGETYSILDQTRLPQQEVWLPCDNVATLVDIIQRLAIRGAPAIGISASILLALLAERGAPRQQLARDAEVLRAARPTAVNLMNNIDRLKPKIDSENYPQSLIEEAESLYREDLQLCEKMARFGARLIQAGEKVLTHCNTGGLATAGLGTALGVITEAHRQGKQVFVWVDETRPLLQGGRLTTWECLRRGIPHRVICDNAAAMLMQKGQVDRVFVGSDRIAANGDFANKIGTYAVAVAAYYHQIPFYVVAPQTTVDPHCPTGESIPIEQRTAGEVRGVSGSFGSCQWCPDESEVFNPAFDVTPAALVTAWVLDTGVFDRQQLNTGDWWLG